MRREDSMNRRTLLQMTTLPLMLMACALSLACGGGGGGGGGNPPTLMATFNPANQNPGQNTVSMGAGAAGGTTFSVQVMITDIPNFNGASFHLLFDPATAEFTGFTSTGSFINGVGQTNFSALVVPGNPGEVAANGILTDGSGVGAVGSQLLMTLNFRATAATGANNFNYGIAADREVQVCPPLPAVCSTIPDGNLTWSGGTMTAN